jgi:DNA-binding transcriptional LysR family regulator
MNTRFIETFVTLAQQGSFRATARLLHSSPATISTRIKALEEELNAELIDRDSTEFRLTPSGQALLVHAKKVVEAAQALKRAAGLEPEVEGPIRFGVIDTIVHSWLSAYVRQLKEHFPRLFIELTVDSSPALRKKLANGDLDIAVFAGMMENDKFASQKIASYPMRWIVSREMQLAGDSDAASLVLVRPVMTFGRGTASHLAVERILHELARDHGVPESNIRIICSSSVAAIVQLVRDCYGIAAIPMLFASEEVARGQFAELPLEPLPPSIEVSLCTSINAPPAVKVAAQMAKESCERYRSQMSASLITAAC